jgi:hypothetical protein
MLFFSCEYALLACGILASVATFATVTTVAAASTTASRTTASSSTAASTTVASTTVASTTVASTSTTNINNPNITIATLLLCVGRVIRMSVSWFLVFGLFLFVFVFFSCYCYHLQVLRTAANSTAFVCILTLSFLGKLNLVPLLQGVKTLDQANHAIQL